MQDKTQLNTKLKNLLAGSILFTAPALSMAAVTFTEIPVDNWGGSIAVANNGTVAFAGDTELYKWSPATGLVKLGETQSSRAAISHISNDGHTVMFANVTELDKGQGSDATGAAFVYQGTTERVIRRSKLNVDTLATNAPILGGGVSTKGYHQAATLNLTTNIITQIPDSRTVEYLHAKNLSANGKVKLLTTPGSEYWYGPNYLMSDKGGALLVEGMSFATSLSGDGQTVVGEKRYCTDGSFTCAASWNSNTRELTEIGHFSPTDTNHDGSMIVGNGWGDSPGGRIWDSYNGTRKIIDVLTANGINMTGWSDFKNLNISDDGNKIAGYATNPQGQVRPFLISIIPQCVGF